jgi:hypothetical protein
VEFFGAMQIQTEKQMEKLIAAQIETEKRMALVATSCSATMIVATN